MKYFLAAVILLLLTTNIFWLYTIIDQSITLSYTNDSYDAAESALNDALKIMPSLASKQTKDDVLKTIEGITDDEPFEKDGCVWADNLGFKFENNRLVHVSTSYAYDYDPCFPE